MLIEIARETGATTYGSPDSDHDGYIDPDDYHRLIRPAPDP